MPALIRVRGVNARLVTDAGEALLSPRELARLRANVARALEAVAVRLVAATSVRRAAAELGMRHSTVQDIVMARRGPLLPGARKRRPRAS